MIVVFTCGRWVPVYKNLLNTTSSMQRATSGVPAVLPLPPPAPPARPRQAPRSTPEQLSSPPPSPQPSSSGSGVVAGDSEGSTAGNRKRKRGGVMPTPRKAAGAMSSVYRGVSLHRHAGMGCCILVRVGGLCSI